MKIFGALFKNKGKQEGDKRPDYNGNGRSEDKTIEYDFAAWVKPDKNGNKYLSVQIKPKEDEQPEQAANETDSSNLPF